MVHQAICCDKIRSPERRTGGERPERRLRWPYRGAESGTLPFVWLPLGGPRKRQTLGVWGQSSQAKRPPFRFELRRGFVFQATVRTSGVVVLAEVLDDSVGLVSI